MARFTEYHRHAISLLALLLFACINNSHPLTPPTLSSDTLISPNNLASVPPSTNNVSSSSSSSEEVSERHLPDDPFTFDNDEGWAVKYTHWQDPSYRSDLVDELLSGALTRLARARGARVWDRSRARRSFFFSSDPHFRGLHFDLQRLPSPPRPLTYEGVRVALQGAQYLADEFETMVMGFEIYLYRDSIGGPLIATGSLGSGTGMVGLGGGNDSSSSQLLLLGSAGGGGP